MKVQYLGQEGEGDTATHFGIRFERKGAAVDVPDDHPMAHKFANNRFFKVTNEPAGMKKPLAVSSVSEFPEPPATPALADPAIRQRQDGAPMTQADRLGPDQSKPDKGK